MAVNAPFHLPTPPHRTPSPRDEKKHAERNLVPRRDRLFFVGQGHPLSQSCFVQFANDEKW